MGRWNLLTTKQVAYEMRKSLEFFVKKMFGFTDETIEDYLTKDYFKTVSSHCKGVDLDLYEMTQKCIAENEMPSIFQEEKVIETLGFAMGDDTWRTDGNRSAKERCQNLYDELRDTALTNKDKLETTNRFYETFERTFSDW